MAQHAPIELTDDHVLHLDHHLVAVNKEAGWPVHATRDPDRPHLEGAVARWLIGRAGDDGRGGSFEIGGDRPVAVHRLDVWTSGVVVLARTAEARAAMGRLFEQREVTKVYEAVCRGGPPDDRGERKHFLAKRRERGRDVMRSVRSGGKVAITRYEVLRRGDRHSLVRLEPLTGRTHQLRAQTATEGWPIVGDRLYGRPESDLGGQLLHARSVTFVHPVSGDRLSIEAAPPAEFECRARPLR